MNGNEFILELSKLIKKEPENLFAGDMATFAEDLKEANAKFVAKRLADRKAEIEAISVEDENIDNQIKRKRLQDSYDNAAMMIGESDAFSTFDTYSINAELYNWYKWTAMYISSWVFARAIDRPATDMIRAGWKVKPKLEDKVEVEMDGKTIRIDNVRFDYDSFYEKQANVIDPLIQAIKWSRLYGGAVCCLLTEEENIADYEKPYVKLKKDQPFQLLVADRWQKVMASVEMVDEVGSPDYNTPKYYSIVTDSGSYRFHHTRVLRFVNGEAPDMIKRFLQGWGIPEGVRLFNEINRDEKIKNMITSALGKHSLEIVKMSGMKQYMSQQLTPEMEAELDSKLAMINRYRSFNSLLFLDKDDEYQRQDGASLGTLSALMNENSRYIAGMVPMPQVLMYGDQQNGLSGNSFDDLALYEDHLMSLRNSQLRPAIIKLSRWLADAAGSPVKEIKPIFNSIIPVMPDKKVENTNTMLDLWERLKGMGLYTDSMILSAVQANRDDLAIGDEVTDEMVEKAIEKEHLAAQEAGGTGTGDVEGDVDSGDGMSEPGEDFDVQFPETGGLDVPSAPNAEGEPLPSSSPEDLLPPIEE